MKNVTFKWVLFACCVLSTWFAVAQPEQEAQENDLIQFSGIVLSADSLEALSGVTIRVANTRRGTASNADGFFSIVVRKNDTLVFTAIGLKQELYIVPETLKNNKYTIIKTLSEDTLLFGQVLVRPFISKELFQHYFVTLELPDEYGDIAKENLDPDKIRELSFAMGMDGNENSKYYLNQQSYKYYYAGQMPPIQLMNPFAWAQFFKAWKDGKLKRQ